MDEASRRGFLTGGTWCADHNKLIERWPEEDTIMEILSETVEGGGSACNFGIDVRRLDPSMPVDTIGVVGDDGDGMILLAQAREAGIGTLRLHVEKGARTNFTDAYAVRSTGRRTHLFHQGASAMLSPDHFDFSGMRARIFHLGLPGIHAKMDGPWGGEVSGWLHVLKAARRAGLRTNLELLQIEPERLRALAEPCLGALDILVVNDFEIGSVTGTATVTDGATDVEACRRAGEAVMAKGSMAVLAVHFPMGALAFDRAGNVVEMPSVAVPQAEVRGANGAGDAFAAGFLYGVHEDWSVGSSLRLAHACAAASLRSIGTTSAVETWQGCLDLAARWGWRG